MPAQTKSKGLRERLANGELVLAAEGYVYELERRGYLQAGPFVPEVVLEKPDLVRQLTREFADAGSDITLALTYNANREKLRAINRENDVEALNRNALKIAREVADETGTLMAGNLSSTGCYNPSNEDSIKEIRRIFKEGVEWAAKGGADLVLAESFNDFGEAMLALEAIKQYAKGLPAVVLIAPQAEMKTRDGVNYAEACKRLEEAGADCVGLCSNFGPQTIVPVMREIRKVCKGALACLPVGFRTSEKEPQMQSLSMSGQRASYEDLDAFSCTLKEIEDFGKAMKEIGVQYIGISCGNSSRKMRKLAETMGRKPAASRYAPDTASYSMASGKRMNKGQAEGIRYNYGASEVMQ